jgi:hypothetical protein
MTRTMTPVVALGTHGEPARRNAYVPGEGAHDVVQRRRAAVAGNRLDPAVGRDLAHPVVDGDVERAIAGAREVRRLVQLSVRRRSPVTAEAGLTGAGDDVQLPRRQSLDDFVQPLVGNEEDAVGRDRQSRGFEKAHRRLSVR